MIRRLFVIIALLGLSAPASDALGAGKKQKEKPAKPAADDTPAPAATSPWGDFYEKDFPFFSSVLDARDVGEGFPKDNLTPRGIILNLGHNLWACFDTDLLRIACIWEGEEGKPPVTPEALAPGSYHVAGQKTKDGQDDLPKPIGKVWLASGIYPGWQIGDKPSFTDPREPGPSKEEVGRGNLEEVKLGSVNLLGVVPAQLRFRIKDTDINATIESKSGAAGLGVLFTIDIGPHESTLSIPLGRLWDGPWKRSAATSDPLLASGAPFSGNGTYGLDLTSFYQPATHSSPGEALGEIHVFSLPRIGEAATLEQSEDGTVFAKVPPFPLQQNVGIYLIKPEPKKPLDSLPTKRTALDLRWTAAPHTNASLSNSKEAYVLDDIPLPLENPWKRNVRLADIDFLDDKGNAVGVTMDGDVWLISGLVGEMKEVKWKRFASGLHEPMSIVVRHETGRSTASALETAAFDLASATPERLANVEKQIAEAEMKLTKAQKNIPPIPTDDISYMFVRQLEKLEAKLLEQTKAGAAEKEVSATRDQISALRKAAKADEAEKKNAATRRSELETLTQQHATLNHERDAIRAKLGISATSIFVFDRNGIWKLVDTNGDGECDRYEMFCNLFAQTAETREFPNSMKLGPKGELYISKGGQEGTTFGKHNGTVIKVAPDGKSFEVIGYGLRQPFIGVHPKTGLVTASDQQGNYVPSTPLHIISDHHFYGHLPTIAPKEQYPETITEPLTWIPHPVNPSSVSQVWLTDAKMGPLNDEFMLVGYNRPELFRVLMNTRFQRPQATVMSFWRDFDFGPLNAHINPADGQLYVVGFQIWGTTAKKISGLARIRYTGGERVMLKECTPTDKGLILRFNAKLDAKLATDPASYSAERWNYKRTPEYGSPHLKLDGSPGQEWINASSAYLSKDGMSVLVGLPDMKAGVHQMRIGWGLKSETGLKAENTAYFTPWELATFDAVKEGFGDIKVDLTPRKTAEVALAKPTTEEGQRLYQMVGCMACHSTDGTTVGKVGPSWRGIYGTEREIGKANGENVKTPLKVNADEAYLHESIVNPPAKVVKGFEKFDAGMPIYNGILNESQIQSLILFIKSLK